MLVCSVFGACYLIYQAYRTMKDNPIIESPALGKAPTWEVPFPAVTVCALNNFNMDLLVMNRTKWPDYVDNLLPTNMYNVASSSF